MNKQTHNFTWDRFFKERKIQVIPEFLQDWYLDLISGPIDWFIKKELHPNFFTVLGLLISTAAAYLLATGHFHWGGFWILMAGTCDIIDGRLARAREMGTAFGALFDSVVDRYSEVIVFFGISFYFVSQSYYITSVIAFIALGGSLMVSYVRARAEGLGFDCKVGIMQRPERIVYMGVGSMIHMYVLIVVMWALAVFTNYTAIQRVLHVWQITHTDDAVSEIPSASEPQSSQEP